MKALTGVDTDRLPEEKARGITLDLGYAYTPLPDGSVLGFIDVPGHEKLIHNMLAGATGIDFVLLVVAADDGPMPQTREHLEMIDLLGLTRGAVALTKCDMVDAARVEAAQREIAEMLAGTALAGSPVFPLSAVSGDGVPALRAHLEAAAATHRARSASRPLPPRHRPRLHALRRRHRGDRHGARGKSQPWRRRHSFAARLQSPRAQPARAGPARPNRGQAGDRCALALTGDFEKQDIARGMWVRRAGTASSADPLPRRDPRAAQANRIWSTGTPVHVHLAASDVTGRVALLDCDESQPLAARRWPRSSSTARSSPCAATASSCATPARCAPSPAAACSTASRRRATSARPSASPCSPRMRDDDPATTLAMLAERSPAGIDLVRFAANWNLDDEAARALWQRASLRVDRRASASRKPTGQPCAPACSTRWRASTNARPTWSAWNANACAA